MASSILFKDSIKVIFKRPKVKLLNCQKVLKSLFIGEHSMSSSLPYCTIYNAKPNLLKDDKFILQFMNTYCNTSGQGNH